METPQIIKVLVLTSSRADFGIYLPLLKKLKQDISIDMKIIAFGTHLSKFHGYTIDQIYEAGFEVDYKISSLLTADQPVDIATSFSLTSLKFSDFWDSQKNNVDVALVLGDRFEMAAAVYAGIPFGINFAHLYGGETTLGAIDNIFRSAISLASKLHFVSLEEFKVKLNSLFVSTDNECHIIGSLGLENLTNIKLLSVDEFYEKWKIDLSKDSVLITVHPETVSSENNKKFANELFEALKIIGKNKKLIITMPNADTSALLYREMFHKLKFLLKDNIILIENFGVQSYFTCMKYSGLMIGNTSSGITEAASFNKYVLNLGDRQKGRPTGNNVISIPFELNEIINFSKKYFGKIYSGNNIYYKKSPSKKILEVLKKIKIK
jgi:GDP/UDP-N,N'-diacetylbacillosamine 2-epimerase (hydrolysing)